MTLISLPAPHSLTHTPGFSLWCKTQRLVATPGQMDALWLMQLWLFVSVCVCMWTVSAVVKQMEAVQQVFQTVSHCLGCGSLQLDICWREKSVTQTTRFTVDEGEINKTKQILMVQTVLAQFKVCQTRGHHA